MRLSAFLPLTAALEEKKTMKNQQRPANHHVQVHSNSPERSKTESKKRKRTSDANSTVKVLRSNEAHKVVKSKEAVPEVGQSSNSASPKFRCGICVERKHVDDLFQVQRCTHSYCAGCITQYIISKLDQSFTRIKCPVQICGGFLEIEHCRSILPNDVYERWGKALCEALIPSEEKFYCPFKDCSAILIKDGNEAVRESECPHCYRLFCAQCASPWHSEMECTEFQNRNKDEKDNEDKMLIKLAKKKKWKRCPSCKFYVQKKNGCNSVKCRCGVLFCYSCGTKNRKCKCAMF